MAKSNLRKVKKTVRGKGGKTYQRSVMVKSEDAGAKKTKYGRRGALAGALFGAVAGATTFGTAGAVAGGHAAHGLIRDSGAARVVPTAGKAVLIGYNTARVGTMGAVFGAVTGAISGAIAGRSIGRAMAPGTGTASRNGNRTQSGSANSNVRGLHSMSPHDVMKEYQAEMQGHRNAIRRQEVIAARPSVMPDAHAIRTQQNAPYDGTQIRRKPLLF